MGIFSIGMLGAASLFPVAALLQKETRQEIIGEHAGSNAVAILAAKGVTEDELAAYPDLQPNARIDAMDNRVLPLLDMDRNKQPDRPLGDRFTLLDRSMPSYVLGNTPQETLERRDLFWTPLIQDRDPAPGTTQWVLYLFIMERDDRVSQTNGYQQPVGRGDPTKYFGVQDPTVPAVAYQNVRVLVARPPDKDDIFQFDGDTNLSPGDMILDNNGTIYSVKLVQGSDVMVQGRILQSESPIIKPTQVYYAPPGRGGTSSPAINILVISNSPEQGKQIITPAP